MEKEAAAWYKDRLDEMRAEIRGQLNSPRKYLDADFTAEATSGRNIYDRYHSFRDRIREEFPHDAHRIPDSIYETDEIGGLRPHDLANLNRDIESLGAIIQENCENKR